MVILDTVLWVMAPSPHGIFAAHHVVETRWVRRSTIPRTSQQYWNYVQAVSCPGNPNSKLHAFAGHSVFYPRAEFSGSAAAFRLTH